MKVKDGLAAQHWIDNTDRIYKEDLHVSSPVMEAYVAGFEMARHLAAGIVLNQSVVTHWTDQVTIDLINKLGEDDET